MVGSQQFTSNILVDSNTGSEWFNKQCLINWDLIKTSGSEENYDKILKEIETQFKQSHAEDIRLNDAKLELEESEDSLKQELRRVTMECQNLKQRQTARLDYIRTNEPDVYKSIEWLEQHRHLFQSKIYNPLLLEVVITTR